MTDRLRTLSDDDLGLALKQLSSRLDYPALPDLAASVGTRIRTEPPGRVIPLRRSRRARRALILSFAAVLLLGGAALAGRLGVPGLRIIFSNEAHPSPSIPVGRNLFLGEPSTLRDARDRVSFEVLTPHGQGLGPAEVHVGKEPPGGRISLLYPPRPGLPVSPYIRAGLLMTEFRASLDQEFVQKVAFAGTRVASVEVSGEPGFWFSGEPHELVFLDSDGLFFQESPRLAGNTLVWHRGQVTFRLECLCRREVAIRIAESMR